MDSVSALRRRDRLSCVLVCVLLCVSVGVRAQSGAGGVNGTWRYFFNSNYTQGPTQSVPTGLCAASLTYAKASQALATSGYCPAGSGCIASFNSQTGAPPNSTLSCVWNNVGGGTASGGGAAVVCPVGTGWSNATQLCEMNGSVACMASEIVSTGTYDMGTSGEPSPRNGCTSGCETSFSGGMTGRVVVGGVYHYFFSGNYAKSGSTCTTGASIPSTGSVPGPSCGAGQTLGQVNGSYLCLNSATGTPENPNVASSNGTYQSTTGGGTTTTTETRTPAGGSGAPGGGTVTTVTVTNDATGEKTVTTTGEDPLPKYCELHPKDAICSKTSFGGSCSGGFTCEGDAAQCAIARELYTRNCALFDSATTLSTLGNAAAAGTDSGTTSNPALAANRESVSMSALISQSRFIGTTTLADQSFSMPGGGSLTVPWSRLVDPLTWAGNILIAFALLAAVRFVFR